jgi:hypothetical protein
MIWYGREYSPARGWDLENDTIKTVGRKTILNKYYKNKFHYFEIKLVKFIYLSTTIADESEVLKTIVLIRNNFETMIVNFYHT